MGHIISLNHQLARETHAFSRLLLVISNSYLWMVQYCQCEVSKLPCMMHSMYH